MMKTACLSTYHVPMHPLHNIIGKGNYFWVQWTWFMCTCRMLNIRCNSQDPRLAQCSSGARPTNFPVTGNDAAHNHHDSRRAHEVDMNVWRTNFRIHTYRPCQHLHRHSTKIPENKADSATLNLHGQSNNKFLETSFWQHDQAHTT